MVAFEMGRLYACQLHNQRAVNGYLCPLSDFHALLLRIHPLKGLVGSICHVVSLFFYQGGDRGSLSFALASRTSSASLRTYSRSLDVPWRSYSSQPQLRFRTRADRTVEGLKGTVRRRMIEGGDIRCVSS